MPAMHEVSLGGRRAAEMRGYLLLAAANPRRGQPDWLIGDAAVLRVIGYQLSLIRNQPRTQRRRA